MLGGYFIEVNGQNVLSLVFEDMVLWYVPWFVFVLRVFWKVNLYIFAWIRQMEFVRRIIFGCSKNVWKLFQILVYELNRIIGR